MSRADAGHSPNLWPVRRPATAQDLLPAPVVVSRTGAADPAGQNPAVAREPWPCHDRRWGPRPRGGLWLVDAVASAGLSGCGGGYFPAARKWRAALSDPGPVTVVANAAESESLSAKDATLLRLRPHLVLDGLVTLSETLGATSRVLWMHDHDAATRRAVGEAIRERQRAGLDEGPASIRAVAGGYLAGESSAIKHALEGGPLTPRFHGFDPANPAGRAILVHNVETLARLSVLSRQAVADGVPVARRPRPNRPGTRLLTVLTPRDRRVVEVPGESRLGEAVAWVTGRQPSGSAAVLLAGFGGMWAPWSRVAGVTVDERVVRRRGLTLGAGIVAPLWDDTCGVAVTAAIAGYLARASARQCGPCLFGLPALADRMARLRDGTARRTELAQLGRDLEAVGGRGACHHPDGAVRLVRSALETFREDVARHAAGSPCGHAGDTIPVPGG